MGSDLRELKGHVFVVPYPGQGHVSPMLQFGKRLVANGVKVTLVLTRHLLKTSNFHPQSGIQVETISDGYDSGFDKSLDSYEEYYETFKSTGFKSLSELIKSAASSSPVTAIVYDSFIPWAKDIAKKFNLLAAAFLTQSCAVNLVYYLAQRGDIPLPLEGESISIPGLTLEASDVPYFVSKASYCAYPVIQKLVIQQFKGIDGADWVLANEFYEQEPEVVDWMKQRWRIATVGPTVPSMLMDRRIEDDKGYGLNLFVPDTTTCMTWLERKPARSVVYVSFGSLAELAEEQMEELACGLEQSGVYFIWVVRSSEEGKLPSNFRERVSEKGLVVNWCPQLDVLTHESVGCFVTHCGFNSILEGLSFGVPMVAVPQWTDQPTNAKYVSDVWKVGVRARPDEKGVVRREAIAESVKEVIEGKEVRENARKWSELAKKAVSDGGSSDLCIKEFAADVHLHRIDPIDC